MTLKLLGAGRIVRKMRALGHALHVLVYVVKRIRIWAGRLVDGTAFHLICVIVVRERARVDARFLS